MSVFLNFKVINHVLLECTNTLFENFEYNSSNIAVFEKYFKKGV